ncbi:MAG: hypothetical protein JSS50_02980 [Proteobacteria bacterium]|nr:hypothetical protein [Pseudomonadota bacterium]
MLIFTSIYWLTKTYYSGASWTAVRSWNFVRERVKSGYAASVALGIVAFLAMTIFVPAIFLLPPLVAIMGAPLLIPVFLATVAANILNVLYRSVVVPVIQAFYDLDPIREVISAPVKYLNRKGILASGWQKFADEPQGYMISLTHNFILCSLIMAPEYYCIRYLIDINSTDWFLHLLLLDTSIGVALQFSPSCKLQQKLNKNDDHALILGAMNGFFCGLTQGSIGHWFLATYLNLGASGTLTGCVINIACAQVFKQLFEWTYDKVGHRLPGYMSENEQLSPT